MRAKIALTAAAITAVNVSTMVVLAAQTQFAASQENGYLVADAAASLATQQVAARLSSALGAAQNMGNAILGLHSLGVATRPAVNALLRKNLQEHPQYIGMYTGWEPNAFDRKDHQFKGRADVGSSPDGRYMPYFQWNIGQVELTPLVDFDVLGAGDYYLLPKKTYRPALVDPYLYPVGDKDVLITSVVVPLLGAGRFMGISGVDISMERLQRELAAIRPLGTGQVYLYSASRRIVSAPETWALGGSLSVQDVSEEQWALAHRHKSHRFQDERGMSRFLKTVDVEGLDTHWLVDVRIPRDTIMAPAERSRNIAMAAGLGFLLLDVALVGWIVLRQMRPLHDVKQAIETTGDSLTVAAPTLQPLLARSDEIGMVARSIESLRQKLSVSFENLEANVHERTQELSEALAELRRTQNSLIENEKLAGLGALVAGVSHELNTPLGNALTVVSTLHARLKGLRKDVESKTLKRSDLEQFLSDGTEMVSLAQRSLDRAQELISNFKQVARDQTAEQRRTFDLHQVVEENVSTFVSGARLRHIEVVNQVPQGLRCDSFPGPLGQILHNLIQNAAVHAFDEGVPGRIVVAASKESDQISLTLADNGKGMDPATLAHAFEPFFTTRLGKGGSGLGLSISKRIATTILSGDITARSEPGAGTEFTLVFPAIAPGQHLNYAGPHWADTNG